MYIFFVHVGSKIRKCTQVVLGQRKTQQIVNALLGEGYLGNLTLHNEDYWYIYTINLSLETTAKKNKPPALRDLKALSECPAFQWQ